MRLSLAQPDSYTSGGGGRESGEVLYIELSQRNVLTSHHQQDTIAHRCLFPVHRHRKIT